MLQISKRKHEVLMLVVLVFIVRVPMFSSDQPKHSGSPQGAHKPAATLKADSRDAGKPLVHFWSTTVGAGRANEGLRASWQEQLQLASSMAGFRYVRFHGLFHDDMFVYQEQNGKPIYNFQYIDDLFDRLLDAAVRPFVELSFSPADMATVKATTMWWKANGSPPKDYQKWADLVSAFTSHCIDRYGINEVRTWYFEVWNEPDLKPFFEGTRTQYFELYKVTARAIKKIDAQLRVGGPATSNFVPDGRFDGEDEDRSRAIELKSNVGLDALPWHPVWVEQFLDYCHRNQLPVDFVSTHPYPTDFVIDEKGTGHALTRSVDSTREDLKTIRSIVDRSPYPKAEIHLTEWSSSPWLTDNTHDSLPAATYIVKENLESAGLVDSLSYWTFTDVFEEGGAGPTIFHGGFGLINYQGIVKPAFHAYRFLNCLGDELLASSSVGVVTRDRKSGRLSALVYNYPAEMRTAVPTTGSLTEADQMAGSGELQPVDIVLTGMPVNASVVIEILDQNHGSATAAWEAMGRPDPPTREQTRVLRKAAQETQKEMLPTDATGSFVVHRRLAPWAVLLLRQIDISGN
jgi:xylan 1,4-beta-xylosidase